MLKFRRSTLEDTEAMAKIAEEGKALLKSRGVPQWQKGNYPNLAIFQQDVRDGIGYVVERDGEVIAACAVTYTEDPSYKNLTGGVWLTEGPYATIHRSAVKASVRGAGTAGYLFEAVVKMAGENGMRSVRVDTHELNLGMQRALAKAGFSQCCRMNLVGGDEDGDPRLGFEKVLS